MDLSPWWFLGGDDSGPGTTSIERFYRKNPSAPPRVYLSFGTVIPLPSEWIAGSFLGERSRDRAWMKSYIVSVEENWFGDKEMTRASVREMESSAGSAAGLDCYSNRYSASFLLPAAFLFPLPLRNNVRNNVTQETMVIMLPR